VMSCGVPFRATWATGATGATGARRVQEEESVASRHGWKTHREVETTPLSMTSSCSAVIEVTSTQNSHRSTKSAVRREEPHDQMCCNYSYYDKLTNHVIQQFSDVNL